MDVSVHNIDYAHFEKGWTPIIRLPQVSMFALFKTIFLLKGTAFTCRFFGVLLISQYPSQY